MSLCSQVLIEVQSTIGDLLGDLARGAPVRDLLDVGCWDGAATARHAARLGCRAHGIEVFDAPAAEARARGIDVARIDLEHEPFPWPDHSMDVVIANQVFEHLKNVWLPMSELHRVTRPGGHAMLSVPNLASLHNRVMLGLGLQPSSIRTFGPHVRGWAYGEFRRFIAFGNGFEIVRAVGVGMHPLPSRLARPFARAWPGASHTVVIVARRVAGARPRWLEHLHDAGEESLQTFYPVQA